MGNPKARCWQTQCLVEAHILAQREPSSHYVITVMVEGMRELSGVFNKGTTPPTRLHPHDLTTSQKLYVLIPSPGWLGFQHMHFVGRQTSVYMFYSNIHIC